MKALISDCSKERIRLFTKSRPTSPRNLRTNLKRRHYHTWLDRPWTRVSEWMFGSPADGMTHWTFGRQLEALLFNLNLKSLLYKNSFFASSSKRRSLTHYRASFWVILSQQVFWARLRTERLLMKSFFFFRLLCLFTTGVVPPPGTLSWPTSPALAIYLSDCCRNLWRGWKMKSALQ